MSDERLRELERRWKETGAVEDEAAFLLERVRVGELTQERLELAAAFRSPGAQAALAPEAVHTVAVNDARVPLVSGIASMLLGVSPRLSPVEALAGEREDSLHLYRSADGLSIWTFAASILISEVEQIERLREIADQCVCAELPPSLFLTRFSERLLSFSRPARAFAAPPVRALEILTEWDYEVLVAQFPSHLLAYTWETTA